MTIESKESRTMHRVSGIPGRPAVLEIQLPEECRRPERLAVRVTEVEETYRRRLKLWPLDTKHCDSGIPGRLAVLKIQLPKECRRPERLTVR